jgi:hypothetical protein
MKDAMSIDSLGVKRDTVDKYKNNYTFLLKIEEVDPGVPQPSNDINFREITKLEEYADRFKTMNFNADEMVSLNSGDEEVKPILYNAINTYGLSKNVSIIYVFPGNYHNYKEDELSFVFDDNIFNRGS